MPDQQPFGINEQKDDWDSLQRTLNYMFKDVYSILDKIQGRANKTFEPGAITLPSGSIIDHNHTAATQGGDYPWADITEGNVTLLQALSQVAAGADAVGVSDPPTQAEVNAIVAVINNIWDKIQSTGIMT